MKVKIHREGLNILLALLFILLVINVPLYILMENRIVPIIVITLSSILYLLVVNFFRSPRRHFKGNPENIGNHFRPIDLSEQTLENLERQLARWRPKDD